MTWILIIIISIAGFKIASHGTEENALISAFAASCALTHISFLKNIWTRHQRIVKTKEHEQFFEMYENLKARDFLYFVLSCYEKNGITELQIDKLGNLIKLNKLGTTKDAAQVFEQIN